MQIRPLADSQKRFADKASAASGDYKAGVQGAGQRWLEGAANAGDSYRQGVTEAANAGRFERGVRNAGPGKYQENAATLGPERYRTGVTHGAPNWSRGYGPIQQSMAAFEPGPRGPRGSPQNEGRMTRTAQAFRKARLDRLGA